MYAIIEWAGKQHRVDEGAVLDVDMEQEFDGDTVSIDRVLMVSDGETVHVGQPYLNGASVTCSVVGPKAGEKVISFRYRRRKNSAVKKGHRQHFIRVKVESIAV